MSLVLIGRKIGMMRLFSEEGVATAVTVLDVSRNRIVQVKTDAVDGYAAVQMVFEGRRGDRLNKSGVGHLSKAGVVVVCCVNLDLHHRPESVSLRLEMQLV